MSFRHILCASFLVLVPATCLTQQSKSTAGKPPEVHSKTYLFEDLKPNPGSCTAPAAGGGRAS